MNSESEYQLQNEEIKAHIMTMCLFFDRRKSHLYKDETSFAYARGLLIAEYLCSSTALEQPELLTCIHFGNRRISEYINMNWALPDKYLKENGIWNAILSEYEWMPYE